MLAPVITASAVMVLGGALLFSAATPNVDVVTPPGAEAPVEEGALDGAWLALLNEPDMTKVHAHAAEAFTEDATFTMVWGPDEIDVDPDRAHISTRFTDPMRATRTEPLIELPAIAGEQRFVGVYDFAYMESANWPGTVCSAWARQGLVYRLDCVFPDPYQFYPWPDE